MSKSIFSRIIDRELPATIRYEDDEVIAIDDIHPAAPIHVLVIPEMPVASLTEAAASHPEILQKLLLSVEHIAREVLGLEGYRIIINTGEPVQEVYHLHVHVLAGWHTREEANRTSVV